MTENIRLIQFKIAIIRLIHNYPKGLASRRKYQQSN